MVAPLERPEAPLCGRTADLCRLFEAEGAYVWNSLRRLGVPPSDLEDLTHDLFLEVQRRLDDYDPGRPVRPWLFGFALRLALRHRKRAHRRYEQPSTGQENVADASALPDQQLAARQDRRLVLSALEGIDMSRRAVFVLLSHTGGLLTSLQSLGPFGSVSVPSQAMVVYAWVYLAACLLLAVRSFKRRDI